MNKKEKNIILENYKRAYHSQEILKNNKDDTRRTLKFMLDDLGLKKERYIIENEIISERDNISYMNKETYKMIFDTFLRHEKYIHYDLDEIDQYYFDLQYEMTDEENKYYLNQINYIKEHTAV